MHLALAYDNRVQPHVDLDVAATLFFSSYLQYMYAFFVLPKIKHPMNIATHAVLWFSPKVSNPYILASTPTDPP